MYLKALGLILNSYNYSNYDKIYRVFTRDEGKITCVGKGVRKIKSRRAPHLDTLNLVNLNLYQKKSFYYISQSSLEHNFSSIKKSLSLASWSFFVMEAVSVLLAEEEPSVLLFNSLVDVLKKLEDNPSKREVYRFLKNLIDIQGYWSDSYYKKYPQLVQIESKEKVNLKDQNFIDDFFTKKIEEISERRLNSTLLIASI